jgi:hypothetical protein
VAELLEPEGACAMAAPASAEPASPIAGAETSVRRVTDIIVLPSAYAHLRRSLAWFARRASQFEVTTHLRLGVAVPADVAVPHPTGGARDPAAAGHLPPGPSRSPTRPRKACCASCSPRRRARPATGWSSRPRSWRRRVRSRPHKQIALPQAGGGPQGRYFAALASGKRSSVLQSLGGVFNEPVFAMKSVKTPRLNTSVVKRTAGSFIISRISSFGVLSLLSLR